MIDMMDAVAQHHHHHQDMVMGTRSHESGTRGTGGTVLEDHDDDSMVTPKPPQEKKPRPPDEQPLKCPRCDSSNTKFCYYNNYSLTQPRYFCKSCRRYWTKGGTLRNVPVGGGCRKNRKSSVAAAAAAVNSVNNNNSTGAVPCGMMMNSNNYATSLIRRNHHHHLQNMEQYGLVTSSGGFLNIGGAGEGSTTDQNGMFIGGSNGVLQQALMSSGGYDGSGNIGGGDHELSLAFARLQHQAAGHGHGGISSLFGANPNNAGGATHPPPTTHLSDIFANHHQRHNFLDSSPSSNSLRSGAGTGSAPASSFPEMISNMISSTSLGFQDYYNYGNDGGHYGGNNNNNNNCNSVDHHVNHDTTCRSGTTAASEEITYDHQQQQEIMSRSNSTTPNSTVPNTPVAASVIKQELGSNTTTNGGGAGGRSEGLFSGFPWQQLNGHSGLHNHDDHNGVGSMSIGGDLNVHDSSSNGGGSWNVHGLIPSSWHGPTAHHLLNSALI